MDLLTPVISAALGTVFKRASDSLLDPQHRMVEKLVLDEYVQVGDLSQDEDSLLLTSAQEQLVLTTLRSTEFGRLIQSYVLSKMTLDPKDLSDAGPEFVAAFQRLLELEFKEQVIVAEEIATCVWPHIDKFVSHIGSDSLSSNVKGLLTARRSADGAADILQNSSPLPLYVRQLIEAIASVDRIAIARNAAHDIRNEIVSSFGMLNMDHLLEGDFRVDKKDVFIHRTLTERGVPAAAIETSSLPIGKDGVGRVVVLGDPGVGKTTLINHIVAEIAADGEAQMVPILVTCRNFNPDSAFEMDRWVSRDFRIVRSLNIEGQVVKDLLATGQAVVLFDGLDEVIDAGRRSRLVSEIEGFVRRYPLCPVLATARRVGYERIALKENFSVFGLQEFSDAQVAEYARLWFSKRNASEVTPRFLMNSESIRDIRANPLMLSLLCDVYRARGYLPRNRFEVYGNCAELLFTRWDSMREIESPPDHLRYGARLFEELAWLFHSSQNARSGVEERQLVRLLAEFFRRNASVDVSDATPRARRFLEFCADRAWLLSSQYRNEYDERIFSFTHRTFLEYYAAQAIVKRSGDLATIVAAIRRAFSEDPGSVLCDLIVQYYDSSKYDGGADILLELLRYPDNETEQAAESRLSLCLRLADAIALPSHVMDVLVDSVRNTWAALSPLSTQDSSFALFSLNRDARARIVLRAKEWYQARPDKSSPRGLTNLTFLEGMVERWSWFDAAGMTALADEGWRESINELVDLGHQHEPWSSGEVMTYILRHNLDCDISSESIPYESLVALHAFGIGAPGLFTDSIFSPAIHPRSPVAWQVLQERFEEALNRSRKVSARLARRIHQALDTGGYTFMERPSRTLLYWYAFISYEYSGAAAVCEEVEELSFENALLPQIFDQRSAAEARSRQAPADDAGMKAVLDAINDVVEDPKDRRWIRQWVRANSSMIAS
ncbi:NACHT domain-containing NTPase [Paenarthrobacter sp. AMU7]|uniref:NACHT domain-containing NTPase n=1 Tax=Paenarthrobacter sp. AMU7 TaxID=3162492 RepID=A0AB39YMN6_9MICC